MVKKIHPDQKYLDALIHNDAAMIRDIYKKCAGKVRSFVQYNSGGADDAADIFQEALIDVYNQAKFKSLELTCPFEPFLLLVCKRKWLNELKKRSVLQVTKSGEDVLLIGEDTFELAEQLEEQQEQAKIFMEALGKVGGRCREIIEQSLLGDGQEKVAEALGVTYGYLRKKKSECMAALMKIIQPYLKNHE